MLYSQLQSLHELILIFAISLHIIFLQFETVNALMSIFLYSSCVLSAQGGKECEELDNGDDDQVSI